jgi:putative ABC transport system permease protein
VGTNAFVIQYAFITLRKAQSIIAYPGIVTCYLVSVEKGKSVSAVAEKIREELPGVAVYDHQTFINNNVHEMESGFLPLLYVIAVIGAIVLTAILSLLLSINILERRKDFAIMKALGSPNGFLPRLVIQMAFLISTAGSICAIILFFPMVQLIEKLTPEVSTQSSISQIGAVILTVGVISLLSSFISLQRLRRIYPLEAFS